MTATTQSATVISEYLSTLDPDAPAGTQGKTDDGEKKLRKYLWWKSKLGEFKGNTGTNNSRSFRSNLIKKTGDGNMTG